jgi:hypothetical protein
VRRAQLLQSVSALLDILHKVVGCRTDVTQRAPSIHLVFKQKTKQNLHLLAASLIELLSKLLAKQICATIVLRGVGAISLFLDRAVRLCIRSF